MKPHVFTGEAGSSAERRRQKNRKLNKHKQGRATCPRLSAVGRSPQGQRGSFCPTHSPGPAAQRCWAVEGTRPSGPLQTADSPCGEQWGGPGKGVGSGGLCAAGEGKPGSGVSKQKAATLPPMYCGIPAAGGQSATARGHACGMPAGRDAPGCRKWSPIDGQAQQ